MKYWSQLEELKGAKVEVVQVAFRINTAFHLHLNIYLLPRKSVNINILCKFDREFWNFSKEIKIMSGTHE